MYASSSNGRTADSDSVNLGSSPGEAANVKSTFMVLFLLANLSLGEEPSGSGSCLRYIASNDDEVAKPSEVLSL